MSSIGGIYSFASKHVDRERLSTLSHALAVRANDGCCEVLTSQIGFCYCAFHTNSSSRRQSQPHIARTGQILTWDGRLDNRTDLCQAVGLRLSTNPSDVEIVMCAYLEWGRLFVEKLIGDFAFSLWEPATNTLWLARDPSGVRSLFYKSGPEEFHWASDLTALMALSTRKASLDESYVAGFLGFQKDTERTPFVEYKTVRPGFVIEVDAWGEVSEQMFWQLDPARESCLKSDEAYEQQFLALFEDAVRVRLRSDRPVVAELSGGLDSSSIVCMADRLIKSGEVETSKLELVSHVSDECSSSDERRFIEVVERHLEQKSNYLRQDDYPFLTPLEDTSRVSTINPYLTNAGYLYGLRELMDQTGSRIRLSGIGGDELLHSVNDPTPHLTELLRTRRYAQLLNQVGVWSRLLHEPYLRLLWTKALKPSLPANWQAKLNEERHQVPAFIDRDFARRTRLAERMFGVRDIYGFRSAVGRDQSTGFLSVTNVLSLGHYPEVFDHEMSYPFLHRPLVEFLCAIPFDQLLRPGESRSLMRRSLKSILPEPILKRRGKGNPREIVSVMFARQWPIWKELFDAPLVERFGFVNLPLLRAAIDRLRHGVVLDARHIVSMLTLEVWLRMHEERLGLSPHKFSPC